MLSKHIKASLRIETLRIFILHPEGKPGNLDQTVFPGLVIWCIFDRKDVASIAAMRKESRIETLLRSTTSFTPCDWIYHSNTSSIPFLCPSKITDLACVQRKVQISFSIGILARNFLSIPKES
jgi:hypothetical protein